MIQIKDRLRKLVEYMQGLIYPCEMPVPEYKFYRGNDKFSDVENLNTSEWEVFLT